MAQATVSIPHQVVHVHHAIPRVRPPRMLKGSISPNTLPQPEGEPPAGRVWVQGRWRVPTSNSAKDKRKVQSARVERAVARDSHGHNIYAYTHIRTNQVVYSLTRILRNTKVMDQLVFHGKKTVPSALRRDHWTPYFSLHFPPDENGGYAGLLAYRQLRELSLQRQMLPPDEMVITTQEDVDRIKNKHDPIDLELMEEEEEEEKESKLKLPRVGDLLPKKERAKKLMSQKKTAVADLAFVLGLQAEGPSPEEAARLREERKQKWWASVNKRARRRVRQRAEAKNVADQSKDSAEEMLTKASNRTNVGLNHHAAERIAIEAQGTLKTGSGEAVLQRPREPTPEIKVSNAPAPASPENQSADGTMDPVGARREDTNLEKPSPQPKPAEEVEEMLKIYPGQVRVCWADLRDAAYAASWPETVTHAELARMAAAKVVTKRKGFKNTLFTKSIHVIGMQKGTGLYLEPGERRARLEEADKMLVEAREGLESGFFENRDDKSGLTTGERFEQAKASPLKRQVSSKRVYQEARRMKADMAEGTYTPRAAATTVETDRSSVERLRSQGIEVEAPRRGILSQIKGLLRM